MKNLYADMFMSSAPKAAVCPMTMGKTVTGLGWNRLDVRVLRNRQASKHSRANPGSGVT
ncbi:hypothetical protein PXH66_18820 [Synoicihabitans lomoniglobus]|uniref:Uncharacterized protein n=1 Tax=Synoicihabitans lomoniglobus TaxID=2909285 RepID=A0AAE9ZU86_9BACT|nr:hypothetical protein PXH66_18820 [Opitutaceae bacterium LMO-M01]